MKRIAKSIFSVWQTGFVVLVPFIIAISLLFWFWDMLVGLGSRNEFIEKHFYETLGVLLASPLVFGWLISKRQVRDFVLMLCKHIPIVSKLTGSFLNHDFIERMKRGDFNHMPAVKFKVTDTISVTGIVMASYEGPSDSINGPIVKWLVVIIPTAPLAVTGPPVEIHESSAVYVGTGMDVMIQTASFATNWRTGMKK